jgi:[acyl-carrier-protein] S-malonyltransferase
LDKTVFLFPGQGSQSVGMGKDIFDEFAFVRELFEMTEEITKNNIGNLCFKGPMESLTQTINLQPAVTTVSLAFLSVLENDGIFPDLLPDTAWENTQH